MNDRSWQQAALTEFSGWDGRLSSTLRALIRRPGVLTHDFLEGRRVRYISPIRLYLTASLVGLASFAAVLWIPIYATLAFRRVYGGSLARTLMKEVAIGAIYAVTAVVAFVVMIYWVSIAA